MSGDHRELITQASRIVVLGTTLLHMLGKIQTPTDD
jgi:hypothetical protein